MSAIVNAGGESFSARVRREPVIGPVFSSNSKVNCPHAFVYNIPRTIGGNQTGLISRTDAKAQRDDHCKPPRHMAPPLHCAIMAAP